MAANFLHGVETIEIQKGARPIRGVKTAVVGVAGTAPIYKLAAADQSVNKNILVLSDKDAAKYFGPKTAGYTIPSALDAIIDQGKGIMIVVNVFDPTQHKTAVPAADMNFDDDNSIDLGHECVMSVVVKSTGETPITYVEGTDYTVDVVNGIIAKKGAGITANTVNVAFSYGDPTKVTSGDIIGTVDAGGNRTGLQAFKDCYNQLGFFPKILIAPVYGTQTSVVTELESMASAIRAIAMVDAPVGTTFQQAITGRGPEGEINFNTSSERLVLCFPHLKVYDAASNSEKLEPYSQRLAGVLSANDIENGYWWSPSNKEIKGIIGVERAISAMINDPNTEANILNENGIVTTFNSFGTGIRTWGNRSAAWPSVSHPKNFMAVRRTADVLHESVEYAMLQFMDMPINDALIDAIVESVNSFLRTLIARGALIDGKCSYDKAKNPTTEIALGHLTFDMDFMPPVPCERITFESFINIDLLKKLGGN